MQDACTHFGRRLICILLSVSFPLCQGCSLFVGSTQSVTVSATVPEAEVYVDGQLMGRGPVTVELRRNRSHGFMAKVGERVGTVHTGTQISTTGILDIIGGFFFLIPFIGIAAPGFWSLDRDFVIVAVPAAA